MPSTESHKQESKIRKIAKKAARETVERIVQDEDPDLSSDLSFDGVTDDVDVTPSLEHEYVDEEILDFAKRRSAEGDFMKLYIKKDDEYVATKSPGYTIEQLQKEYGPGMYRIFCKRPNGRIAKQAVVRVAPLVDFSNQDQSNFSSFNTLSAEQKPVQPNSLELATFLSTITKDAERKTKEETERAREEARYNAERLREENKLALEKADRDARRSSSEQNTLMTTFLTMMQTMAQNAQTANLEMMKVLNAKIDKAGEGKKEGLDTLTLFKMINDAEEKGYERRADLEELAAERRRDERESDEEKPEGGMIGSLVKAVIPIITQVGKQMQNNPQLPQGPTPQQIAAHNQKVESDRRLAFQRSEVERNRRVNATNQARQEAQGGITGAQINATATQGQGNAVNGGGVVGSASEKPVVEITRDGLGLPIAGKVIGNREQGETTGLSVSKKMNGHFKEHVSTLVFPLIADNLINSGDAKATANQCLDLLTKNGITQKEVVDNFTLDVIMELAAANSVPDAANPWLKEFHGALQTSPGVELNRPS